MPARPQRPHWSLTPSFTDGRARWKVVEAQSLEGLVAKPLGSVYKPGERGWIKVKNHAYWKYEIEREAVRQRVHGSRELTQSLTVANGASSSSATF